MSASVPTLFTETTLDGFPLWVVLLICGGVFLAGFMDAIAGGGGIISVPVYLMAFSGLPTHFVLGTNKLSSCIGTAFSTARFIHQGYVHWRLFLRTKMWPEEPAPIPPRRQAAIVWAAALLIGTYDGYYGPGTGTFLMLVFIHLGKMDTRHAAGGVKVINLASNIGGVCSALMAGTVVLGVGLAAALASILGHYLGAGLAIRNGSKIVRPAVVVVLLLLLVKVISELLFPNFWN